MKTKRIIGIFLTLAMLMSCICPVLAATTKEYNYGSSISISGNSSANGNLLLLTVKNNKSNSDYSLIDTVRVTNNKYNYSFALPSKSSSAASTVWPTGTYTVEVDGKEVMQFKIKSTDGGGGGGGTSSGGGIVIPGTSLSNNGIVEVILNPNQYEKFGLTPASVTTSGAKTTATTFVATVTINGVPTTSFTGYDPVLMKVPYATSTTNKDNLVVRAQNGSIVPRTLYKDGYLYVNTNDISGVFTIVENGVSFGDISSATHDWAMTGVNALAARNIINGVGNGFYEPNRSVTRAEFIKMVVSMFNVYDPSAGANFTDVVYGEWYNTYVGTAQALGITKGYEDGSFRPNDTISREEMSTMLYRAAEILSVAIETTNNAGEFADDWNIQDYAKLPVYKMRNAGILNGVGDNMFDPKNDCTRAQAAVAIYNMFVISMAR